ncbi:MAG: glutathione S-transferase N-terminal domain-containing protein [Peptoniphilus sp.]|nr:glutathione S-transferase N-terminal domain-containing protein [Peptoniphilus sp.]MDD7362594.1 glutathione S-transferase N-terminal domain-containing protein [Bacillota bacterium]MDY6045007.1 glutathione S-transferase N-terminal domain-containing protein [Peptoniphilus sp.]
MDYQLYAATYCPFCRKVINFMEKNELDDKIDILFIDKDDRYEKELLEGGGTKQVPCLHFGDTWMYESDDIIEYLKENLL